MKKKIFILGIIGIAMLAGSFSRAVAQDPSFSQFHGNQLFINPAYAGSSRGLNVIANYRNQWANINSGYITEKLSVDCSFGMLGIAGYFVNDMEGHQMRTQNAGFDLSAGVPLTRKRGRQAALFGGLGIVYTNKRIITNGLYFPDQFDKITGYTGPSSYSLTAPAVNYVGLSGGIILKFSKNISNHRDVEGEFGFSGQTYMKPRQSYTGYELRYPYKLAGYSNIKFFIYDTYLSPMFVFEKQAPLKTLLIGGITNAITSRRGPVEIITGLAYRLRSLDEVLYNSDALILIAGAEFAVNTHTKYRSAKHRNNKGKRSYASFNVKNYLSLSYSYDMTISRLTNASGGSHEIMLGWVFGRSSRWACPTWSMDFYYDDVKSGMAR